MSVYICYLLLAGIQVPVFCRKNQFGKQHFFVREYLFLCCFELILLAGIRGYKVGADTATYLSTIDYYGMLPKCDLLRAKLVYPFNFEIGYFALTKLCVFLGLGKTAFLFVVAIIIYIPIFSSIKNHSPMPYISILCYFAFGMFSYSLGIFRQMIALSILLSGWRYVVERSFIKYALTVFVAMLFHTSAIIGILLYAFYVIKWENIVLFLLPVEIVFLLLGRKIALFVAHLFPKYIGYIGGVHDIQSGTYMMLVLLNIVLLASVLGHKETMNPDEKITVCALALAICVQSVGYSMAVFGRSVQYFSIYIIFAIPNIICRFGGKWKNILSLTAIICLFVLTYIQLRTNKYIVPYYTVF